MFNLIKEIKSKTGELHFRRWRILTTPWFDINIHGIYKADQDKHLHDHPWDIFTIILWGSYVAEKPNEKIKERGFLNMSFDRAEKFHRILIVDKPVYTLAIMSKRKRNWGYSVDGEWIDHETYRKLKNNSCKCNGCKCGKKDLGV